MDRMTLSAEQKAEILRRYGNKCFLVGHLLDDNSDIEFDHLVPIAWGGSDSIENIVPVCKRHNRQKGTLTLHQYKDKLELDEIFLSKSEIYFNDIIKAKQGTYGVPVDYDISDDQLSISLHFGPRESRFPLYVCPVSGWQYFYAMIPVTTLNNDKHLQPRPLRHKDLFEFYLHFQSNTQLSPSIGRLMSDGRVLLFDGQHKASAQVWSGRTEVECKIYIEPDARDLMVTNLGAHQKFRQMQFYPGELMTKYAGVFGEHLQDFISIPGHKSEATLIEYLLNKGEYTRAQSRNLISSAIYESIRQDPDNGLSRFISPGNRAQGGYPLSHNLVSKAIYKPFLHDIPTTAEMGSEQDLRDVERKNMVRMLTIIANEVFVDKWNPNRDDSVHRKAERLSKAGSLRAWSKLVREVMFHVLQLWNHGGIAEANRVLYRSISNEQFDLLEKVVARIFSHPIWEEADPGDRSLESIFATNDDSTCWNLIQQRGLNPTYAVQVH